MVIPAAPQDIYKDFPDSPEQYRQSMWDKTLSRLFVIAVTHASERIAWYESKAARTAIVARRLRWSALLLFVIGTLAPIVLTCLIKIADFAGSHSLERDDWRTVDWLAHVPLAEVGYVMLACAGALVVFDQFFGSSGSWIRFRQSQARLEVLLADFRFSWAQTMASVQGLPETPDSVNACTKLVRDFVIKVEMLAEDETNQWAKRFSEMIDNFDRNPNLKVSLSGSGANEQKADEASAAAAAKGDTKAGGTGSGAGASQHAATTAGATASAPGGSTPKSSTVNLRLAIVGADTLDGGSLQLFVDEDMRPVPPDGLIELQLDAGHTYSVVATGRRKGQTVRGELTEAVTPDDENKSLALQI